MGLLVLPVKQGFHKAATIEHQSVFRTGLVAEGVKPAWEEPGQPVKNVRYGSL